MNTELKTLSCTVDWLVSLPRWANRKIFLQTSETIYLKKTNFLKNHTETLVSTQNLKQNEADTPHNKGLEPDLRPAVVRSVKRSQ